MATKTRNQKISRAMRLAWNKANEICFDGKLPRPAFRVRDLAKVNALALWEEKNGKEIISVDPIAVKNGRFLLRLMMHEMIHQLQWQQKSERTKREQHGRFFRRHADRIEAITGFHVYWVKYY
jgi:hypothetical protein